MSDSPPTKTIVQIIAATFIQTKDDGIRVRANGTANLSDSALLEVYRQMLIQAREAASTRPRTTPATNSVSVSSKSAQPSEPAECKDCDKLMTERDEAIDQADELAACIEGLLGIEIGEHTSGNAPWQNAIDAAEYELDKRKRKRNAETKEPKHD